MGAGATTNNLYVNQPVVKDDLFREIEKRCKSGYYMKNPEPYQLAIEESIKNTRLDLLEILIPAGKCRDAFPLHIACSFAKLESLELLVSAGFPCVTQDEDGRTPLHHCAHTLNSDAALCATAMMLTSSKVVRVKDHCGDTALHYAVQQRNKFVVNAICDQQEYIDTTTNTTSTATASAAVRQPSSKLTPNKNAYFPIPSITETKDKKGYTAFALAKKLRYADMVEVFTAREKATAAAKAAQTKKEEVSMERIMKIWEAFFTNAMNHMGEEMAREDELAGFMYGGDGDDQEEGGLLDDSWKPRKYIPVAADEEAVFGCIKKQHQESTQQLSRTRGRARDQSQDNNSYSGISNSSSSEKRLSLSAELKPRHAPPSYHLQHHHYPRGGTQQQQQQQQQLLNSRSQSLLMSMSHRDHDFSFHSPTSVSAYSIEPSTTTATTTTGDNAATAAVFASNTFSPSPGPSQQALTQWLSSWLLCYSETEQRYYMVDTSDSNNNSSSSSNSSNSNGRNHHYQQQQQHEETGADTTAGFTSLWVEDFLELVRGSPLHHLFGSATDPNPNPNPNTDTASDCHANDLDDLPHSYVEAYCGYWLTFYDLEYNACYWMQLTTGRCEYYLPIGGEGERGEERGGDRGGERGEEDMFRLDNSKTDTSVKLKEEIEAYILTDSRAEEGEKEGEGEKGEGEGEFIYDPNAGKYVSRKSKQKNKMKKTNSNKIKMEPYTAKRHRQNTSITTTATATATVNNTTQPASVDPNLVYDGGWVAAHQTHVTYAWAMIISSVGRPGEDTLTGDGVKEDEYAEEKEGGIPDRAENDNDDVPALPPVYKYLNTVTNQILLEPPAHWVEIVYAYNNTTQSDAETDGTVLWYYCCSEDLVTIPPPAGGGDGTVGGDDNGMYDEDSDGVIEEVMFEPQRTQFSHYYWWNIETNETTWA